MRLFDRVRRFRSNGGDLGHTRRSEGPLERSVSLDQHAGSPRGSEFSVGTPLETNTAGVTNIMETCATLAEEFRGKGQDNLLTVMTRAEIEGNH
ncbi:MAG: hypothetical protein WDN04_19950 [Rhodospirillales bacterium]